MEVSITPICRKDKINKKNEAPLALKISYNYDSRRKSLGTKINIDYWDFENDSLKEETPNKEYIQLIIDSEIQKLNKKSENSLDKELQHATRYQSRNITWPVSTCLQ